MRSTIITIFLFWSLPNLVVSTDTLTISDSLLLNQTLLSKNGEFELGFFTRGNPKRNYVGIWFKNIPNPDNNIFWVANRDLPCYSNSCTFKLGNNSNNLLLENGSSHIIWKSQQFSGKNPVIQLLDSGNLVVREVNSVNFIWQSLDYPTDTIIAGQKIGWNLKTGRNLFLSSWKSPDDPGTGNFSFKMDYHGDPELYLRMGNEIVFRTGPWVGHWFNGVPYMQLDDKSIKKFNFTFYMGSDAVYYTFELAPGIRINSRFVVDYDGLLQRWSWIPNNQPIKFEYSRGQCDYYRACGPYGVCDPTAYLFPCQCKKGFKPKGGVAGSSGCVRKTKLDCTSDGFYSLDNMKLPETTTAYVDKSLDLAQCRDLCKRNCSCTAYANFEFSFGKGSGCVIWTDNLTDMRKFVDSNGQSHYGQTLYMRAAASDLGSSKARNVTLGIGIICIAVVIILIGLVILVSRERTNTRNSSLTDNSMREYSGEANSVDDLELPFFDGHSMAIATDKFSDANKLGQGGFGSVYKGVMPDGTEVAVKRLSKESRQGAEEFKNEVKLIAKLQHRNLVRLLGCCVEQDEKMIIYEYLENKSLDSILFHKEKCSLLNWQTRFNIICGVARGLLYLHQDSRYRIIHRDLKPSNILLDKNMKPKISDFGMARIFGGEETEEYTRRVVGTYGYMAPEYAMDGLFSIKSDVFSFGVLVLEILCGIKNKGFYNAKNDQTFLGYLWEQWRKGKEPKVLDKSVGEIYWKNEVSRCLQIGLLCVQEMPEDRPTMTLVVQMLTSLSTSLPRPKLPGFIRWNVNETDSYSSNKQDEQFTINQVTITTIDAR